MPKLIWPSEFPGAHWMDKKEENAALDVIRNGSLFRYYGLKQPRYADAYEAAARDYYGVRYSLAVNSGTGALLSCLRALGIGPGCEVIVPAFMWVATVGVVVLAGAIPVLCEVDASFTMDPRDLARKITRRTRLIIPIHMTGAPCRIDAIMRVANRHKIPVLEDCAQCNGGRYKGRKVGTFGAMGIFSLQLNKNMTCGEGGLIITNDLKLYNRAFGAHDMGMIRVNGRLALPERDEITWGGGRRMTELCAAIASVQLGKLDTITGHMRESKLRIKKILQTVPGLKFRMIHDPKGDTGAFLTLILKDRAAVEKALPIMREGGLNNAASAANYGLHIYYNIPALVNKVPLSRAGDPWKLHENRASKYDYHKGACPASDALFERTIIMPIPSRLTRTQEQQAAAIISKAVRSV